MHHMWSLSTLALALSVTTTTALPRVEKVFRRSENLIRDGTAYDYDNATMLLPRYDPDTDPDWNSADLTWITKIAAIGDSYSAGIGAGNMLGSLIDAANPLANGYAWNCRQYDHSYPNQVVSDVRVGDPAKTKFQFISCSGAKIVGEQEESVPSVRDAQIDKLDSGQQVIMISAGGNDVGLFNVLNNCIFQWFSFTQTQGVILEILRLTEGKDLPDFLKDFDIAAASRGCPGTLDDVDAAIASKTFHDNLDSLIQKAKGKLSQDGMIYYTGYAKFFSEDYSNECDTVTWSSIVQKVGSKISGLRGAEYLTVDKRKRLNKQVDDINNTIRDAVARAGPQVVFIDIDKAFGKFKARFCETGVDETSADAAKRFPLFFYEWNSRDPFGQDPFKRSIESIPQGTFDAKINAAVQATAIIDPDAIWSGGGLNGQSVNIPDNFNISKRLFGLNLIPDGYGRVFHPQAAANIITAKEVIYAMQAHQDQKNGYVPAPADAPYGACVYIPGSTPITNKKCNDLESKKYVSASQLTQNKGVFCKDASQDDGLGAVKGQPFTRSYNTGTDAEVEFSLTFKDGFDFSHMSDDCLRAMTDLIDGCNVPIGDYNKENNKAGGSETIGNADFRITPLREHGSVAPNIPEPSCNSLDSKKYISPGVLLSNVNSFCSDAAQPNQKGATVNNIYSTTYNDNTPEKVILSLKVNDAGYDFSAMNKDCLIAMRDVLTNDCNVPQALAKYNPSDWKAGGTITIGVVDYSIQPQNVRPPPPVGGIGGCELQAGANTQTNIFALAHVWGGGWQGVMNDNGAALWKAIQDCQGDPSSWKFGYSQSGPDNGQDEFDVSWTYTSGQIAGDQCLANAMKNLGAPSSCLFGP